MKDLIQAHKKLISTVKEQMGFSDYGMYWLAFIEGLRKRFYGRGPKILTLKISN